MPQRTPQHTERGAVMLVTTLLLLGASIVIVAGSLALVKSQVRVLTEHSFGKVAYAFVEGALEDVAYRHIQGLSVDATEVLNGADISVTTVTTPFFEGLDLDSTGSLAGRTRSAYAQLIQGVGASFSFGVQTSDGGIIMENSSSVSGNVYSNGPIIGHNLNDVTGTAISAGPNGYIEEVHTSEHAYAHEIEDSYIDGNAFYQVIDVGTTVDGDMNPGFPDLATTSLPITDAMLDSWKAFASSSDVMDAECLASGGTLVFNTDVTLGPVKIPCDVEFSNFPDVTIAGVIWIEGNLDFTQGPEFTIDPAVGNRSIPIIVDNEADRLTSSQVTMRNSGAWYGNGSRSYSMIISRNESASQGGGEKAIIVEQSSGGALLVYAGHGEINLQNNTDLTMLTAWRVRLENLTEVHYDTGIAATVFEVGPSGGYVLVDWEEVE